MGAALLTIEGRDFVVRPNSDLGRLLRSIARKLQQGKFEEALRDLDREWRSRPAGRPLLAPIYAHLLIQRQRWSSAIGLLNFALATSPDASLEADFAHVLQQTGQIEAALHRLEAALKRYGVGPADHLATRARELTRNSSTVAGWACLTPRATVHAESHTTGAVTFEIRTGEGRRIARKRVTPKAGVARVDLPFPRDKEEVLHVSVDGRPLLGGEQPWPSDFGVDGRAAIQGRKLRGWVRVGWCASRPPSLLVRGDAGRPVRVAAASRLTGDAWGFELDLQAASLEGERFEVRVLLPGGASQPLPGSPFLTRKAARATLHAPKRDLRIERSDRLRPVDVIVPVYQDRERTLACLRSIIETRSEDVASIIVVDDASPDPDLSEDLRALAARHGLHLLRNATNRGFAASVNRAMDCNPEHDVVLVNSDVVVFDGWLRRMRQVAYSSPDIGTVTPLADDDSIVGYRLPSTADPVVESASMDRLCAEAERPIIDLPVGVGFCLYIRRECRSQTGPFDVEIFGSGYGEEADFCMRARAAGWRSVLASNVFVHHAGSKSFGGRRAALMDRSAGLLAARHPGYHELVAAFQDRDPMLPIRRALDMERLRSQTRPIVLMVTLALPGGTDRFIAERMRIARHEGKLPVVLRPADFFKDTTCVLRCEDLELRDTRFEVPVDLPLLEQFLASLDIEVIELHHFLGLDPRVVEMVRRRGVPIDAFIHDYAWVCPRVTLIDGRHSYCGEPAVATCQKCVAKNGSSFVEDISVKALRQRSRDWLSSARQVIAPSEDARTRLRRYFPNVEVRAVPHETFLAPTRPLVRARPSARIRVALLGAIGYHKGYKVLLDCARHAAARELPLEFVIVGFSEDDDQLLETGRVFVTGRYEDSEVQALLAREAPDLVFLPSVWPETWCYTLSHAISSGLPIVAFDIGAIGERLRAENQGTLLPLGLSPARINDRLLELGREARGSDAASSSTSN
jgi:GT2 family glycosyltransferase/glycosyltransferase involved in cell wall biosynthesis